MAARQPEIRKAMAERNKKEGEAFLAENRKKEGIKTLPSGVQYKIIQEGTGNNPKTRGCDCRPLPGCPTRWKRVRQYIQAQRTGHFQVGTGANHKGWMEALLMMKEGAKWQIFIPSDLAYGENGAGPIEPNATLIYDVELITIYSGLVTPPQTTKPGDQIVQAGGKIFETRGKTFEAGSGKVALPTLQVTGVDG